MRGLRRESSLSAYFPTKEHYISTDNGSITNIKRSRQLCKDTDWIYPRGPILEQEKRYRGLEDSYNYGLLMSIKKALEDEQELKSQRGTHIGKF